MSLYTTIGSKNIPEGAVKLSRDEALRFQKKIIRRWKSLTDVVFLEFGWVASVAATTASSLYVTGMVRSLLKLGSHGGIIPYISAAVVPCIMSGFFTEKVVTEKVLLMSLKCPMCMQVQFGALQTLFGVGFPTIISLGFYLPLAQMHNTVPLPDISQDTRKAYSFCYNLLKRRAISFQILAALQLPVAFLLPYMQTKQLDNINRQLRDGEAVPELE